MKGLENLEAYKIAISLKREIYELVKKFPKEERFRLVDQIKRSSSSISANIAESYGKFNYKEKIHALYVARAEGFETKNHILDALDKNLINKVEFQKLQDLYTNMLKVINGYIRFLKKTLSD